MSDALSPTPIVALQAFCLDALMRTGLSVRDAATVSETLVTADAMGVFTHGTKLLIGYLNRLRGGGYRVAPNVRVEREGPAWAIVDGDHGLGQVGGLFAMETAVAKAKQCGIAYVGLKNTGHIGAAGYYAWRAAQAGLIGIVFGNDTPSVAAPGSRGPVLGSNPIAFAIPVTEDECILLDIATSAVAGGKVYAAHQRGESIPATWLIDRRGQPTTDGSLYPHQAALAPMAGHKGYGFALLAEVLAGVLTGGAITSQIGSWMFDDPARPSKHNAAFIAIDVATIALPDEFATRMSDLASELRASPPAEGVECVLLPGDLEHRRLRSARETGIVLPPDVIEKLLLVAEQTGIPWPPIGEAHEVVRSILHRLDSRVDVDG
jgi:ureidoglycolate dehydrogenase (NAD+)